MSPPAFDMNPEKFAETERIWDSWSFYLLMGCPDALVDRAERDLLIQRCIRSQQESLELMRSDCPTPTFSEAWHFMEPSTFVDCPGVKKKGLLLVQSPNAPQRTLTYSRRASCIAKYKRLRAQVRDFKDQPEMEHLLA